jgi:hypothetical protein
MRPLFVAAAGLTLATAAWAQRPSIQTAPLPPLQQQWQQQGTSPVQQAPAAPDDDNPAPNTQPPTGPDTAQTDPTQTPETFPAMVDRPNVWLPAKTVKLQALDKVNAEATSLTIKVGQSATFGSLTILAKACMVRPIDQPANAAALLAVTDSHPDSPNFAGWMLQNEPSTSMMEHPIYDLRVTGCT